MLMGEKRKVVCFTLDNERELFELANSINFSRFVKRHLVEEVRRRALSVKSAEITVRMGAGEDTDD